MNADRKTAIIVGVLYIIGTVAGIASVVVTGPVIGAFSQHDPDYLSKIQADGNQLVLGSLFVLIMGLALAMVPVLMYPISKKHNEVLAVGYVVFRGALEPITYLAWVLSFLGLVTLGRAYAEAGALQVSHFQTLGALLLEGQDWISAVAEIIFPLGALMLYYVLYQARLVPRWIPGWGLIGAIPYLGAGLLVLFGFTSSNSTFHSLLVAPLGLQEMVMAVWLIVKGFNPSANASGAIAPGNQPKFA